MSLPLPGGCPLPTASLIGLVGPGGSHPGPGVVGGVGLAPPTTPLLGRGVILHNLREKKKTCHDNHYTSQKETLTHVVNWLEVIDDWLPLAEVVVPAHLFILILRLVLALPLSLWTRTLLCREERTKGTLTVNSL